MLTKRDYHGEAFYLAGVQDYEAMRALRKRVSSRRPTDAELIELRINKPWEAFWRSVLFD